MPERKALATHDDFARLDIRIGKVVEVPEALVGSLVVCVCNLGPKNIAGFISELLILESVF
jgi:tRNA-binding protein